MSERMSEPTSIKNLRDLVSPTTLGTFHVEPAAVLSAYDTMKQRAEAAKAWVDLEDVRGDELIAAVATLHEKEGA